MVNKKLTEEELKEVNDLQQKNQVLINELGQISLAEINLESRREAAEKFLEELKVQERTVAKKLEDTYGVGTVDLNKGEFIPSPAKPQPGVTLEQ